MESWEHVWEECREWESERKSWQEVVNRILGDNGEGEKWMRKVERKRGKKEDDQGGEE